MATDITDADRAKVVRNAVEREISDGLSAAQWAEIKDKTLADLLAANTDAFVDDWWDDPDLSDEDRAALRRDVEVGSAMLDTDYAGGLAAVEYLDHAGLRILDRNWKCVDGEIPIVAAERNVLVVCEVKTRTGSHFTSPLEQMSRSGRARMRRLASRWLVQHGVLFDEVRIDVIGIGRGASGFEIEHVRGVG